MRQRRVGRVSADDGRDIRGPLGAAYRAFFPFRFVGENISTNESHYYGFRKVDAPRKMLIEYGELTCPAQAAWLRPRLPTLGVVHGALPARGSCADAAQSRSSPPPPPQLAAPRRSAAQTIGGRAISVERFPGIVGIYRAHAQRRRSPLVAVRAAEPFAAASVIKLAIMLTVYRAYDAGARPRPKEVVSSMPATSSAARRFSPTRTPASATPSDVLVDAMIRV